MTANGTPSGGTFQWSMSGAGGHTELVDAAGAPITTGATVFLRSFEPDNSNGKIPAQKVKVEVEYTHPSGTATDSKNVTGHKIDFVVTNTAIHAGVTQANETAGSVTQVMHQASQPCQRIQELRFNSPLHAPARRLAPQITKWVGSKRCLLMTEGNGIPTPLLP